MKIRDTSEFKLNFTQVDILMHGETPISQNLCLSKVVHIIDEVRNVKVEFLLIPFTLSATLTLLACVL